MNKGQAEEIVAKYLSRGFNVEDETRAEEIADAFIFLKYPVPQSLGAELSAILQHQAEPGWVVKAEPYQGRIRIMYIKEKAAAQWAARPPEEYD